MGKLFAGVVAVITLVSTAIFLSKRSGGFLPTSRCLARGSITSSPKP